MEDVFLDFDLDQHYDHIDNRGWMNLFQHWAWSGMLCATWAMTGSTFDPRFQRFCWTRLDLRPGRPSVAGLRGRRAPAGSGAVAGVEQGGGGAGRRRPGPEDARGRLAGRGGPELLGGGAGGEVHARHRPPAQKLFPVYVTVESPRRTDRNPLRFNVGYVIGELEVQGRRGARLLPSLHADPEPPAQDGAGARRADGAARGARRPDRRGRTDVRRRAARSAMRRTKRCPPRTRLQAPAARSSARCLDKGLPRRSAKRDRRLQCTRE